ncbi:hypothetical protein THRCLA_00154 [Thraustotheca clavata]|uniref:C2H2-type domain-containing protein n=1 Tax=Thraustotheca clavata TaxID=74557 RepID=A0A1W0ACU4_9STRA|nr:hypothetical protein THRCLA_00154 [Thraustotheca clavata]
MDNPTISAAIKACIKQCLGPTYVNYYTECRNQLRPGRKKNTGADLELAFAIDVFKQHIRHTRGEKLALRVKTTSEFGLEREFTYLTSQSIGQTMVSILMEDSSLHKVLSDVRCNEKGIISLTTTDHFQWHTKHGRLVCSACGYFFNGQRGLRVHQVLQHGIGYVNAQYEALSSETQLVVYIPRQSSKLPVEKTNAILDSGLEAAKNGDLATLKALVAGGWDCFTTDRHGSNALAWAAGSDHLHVCKFLVESCGLKGEALQGKPGMRRNALHWAARNGSISVCDYLVNCLKIDLDSPTEDGTTPFHFAVWNQQYEMCQWLINEAKCDVHRLNSYGCNASQWSSLTGSVKMMELLQEHGVDLGIRNYNGHSALHKAALRGHLDICRWLVTKGKLGLDHMQADADGFTPITFASANGFQAVGNYLTDVYNTLKTNQKH